MPLDSNLNEEIVPHDGEEFFQVQEHLLEAKVAPKYVLQFSNQNKMLIVLLIDNTILLLMLSKIDK